MEHAARTPAEAEIDEFAAMDATEQAALVRAGKVSALELTDGAIARIERLEPVINALASSDFERARERARTVPATGPFAGVPTLIKDLMAYPGHAVSYGARMFLGHMPPAGSPYTNALDAAGLVVLGKSATSEFGLIGTTESLANGATHNPWDLSLSPGGSSGGAVAAVASGMVPVAHASDGGGSIRGPSSFTGLFGFKPSLGRAAANGMPEELPTTRLISEHCVSRTVRDSCAWLSATERPGIADPLPPAERLRMSPPGPLRIGAYRRDCFGTAPTPAAEAAFDKAVALCRQLGHDVVEIDGPRIDATATSKAYFALTGFAVGALLAQVRQMMGSAFDPSLFEPYTLDLVARAKSLTAGDVPARGETLTMAAGAANALMDGYDLLLSPTVGFPAFPLGRHGPDQPPPAIDAMIARLAGYTVVASLAGWPAMSVPLFTTDDGLPLGCHFAAARDRDALLFSLAFQLEDAAPWTPRLLDLHARLAWRNG